MVNRILFQPKRVFKSCRKSTRENSTMWAQMKMHSVPVGIIVKEKKAASVQYLCVTRITSSIASIILHPRTPCGLFFLIPNADAALRIMQRPSAPVMLALRINTAADIIWLISSTFMTTRMLSAGFRSTVSPSIRMRLPYRSFCNGYGEVQSEMATTFIFTFLPAGCADCCKTGWGNPAPTLCAETLMNQRLQKPNLKRKGS